MLEFETIMDKSCATDAVQFEKSPLMAHHAPGDVIFVIETEGGHNISAHSKILSDKSPIFARQLSSRASNCGFVILLNRQPGLENVTELDFVLFRKFLYTKEIDPILGWDNVINILKLASYYQVEDLRVICESTIVESLNRCNCLEWLAFIRAKGVGNIENLYYTIRNMIQNNIQKVLLSLGSQNLTTEALSTLKEFDVAVIGLN
ncbi:hypothetical protein QAD02_004628 [Eretmocerus hayati]|uniref:Uncharacterized protein n=1 Tax=Eretmocerus hayati TaxID=131215 RepID=A0ACC2NR57_9HYME|nr:hypothetical protein QAD02_004628 [Eretmocerus hayati]